MTSERYQWDFFLAHTGTGQELAERLYEQLARKSRPFLDSRSLQLGDDWDVELAKAQRAAAVTVVIVSAQTSRAYYQREEIAAAIALAREDRQAHRVVPVYLPGLDPVNADVPYGLRLKHGIHMRDLAEVPSIASRLLTLLEASQARTRTVVPTTERVSSSSRDKPPGFEVSESASPARTTEPTAKAPGQVDEGPVANTRPRQTRRRRIVLFAAVCFASAAALFAFVHWRDIVELSGQLRSCNDSDLLECKDKCQSGNAVSCTILGHKFLSGLDGASKDPVRARGYLQKACGMGNAWGCNLLAYVYSSGEGVPRDPKRSVDLLRRACDLDSGIGCVHLGERYETGEDVEKDVRKAATLYQQACGRGSLEAGCEAMQKLHATTDVP